MSAEPIIGTIWEDSGCSLMARVTGTAGTAINQASTASITYKVFDLDGATPGTATQTGSMTVASVVFDTLQTDARWDYDSTGYNLRYTAPATWFPDGDHRYRIEALLTDTSTPAVVSFVVWQPLTRPVMTS